MTVVGSWRDDDKGWWSPSEYGYSSRGTYSIRAKCNNCNFNGFIDIPKGEPVLGRECPHCGCRSLGKV